MRILICTGIYPPDIGGPATYSNLIFEELKKRGHRVDVLTYSSSSACPAELKERSGVIPAKARLAEALAKRAGIQFVNKKYSLLIRYFLYFLKVLKLGKNVDVIYVQDPVSVGLPTALANLFLRKKIILKIVGDYSWETAQQVQSLKFKVQSLDEFYPFIKENYPFKIKLLQKIQTWVAKRANKIITPSFYLKNILTKGWGIDDKKIKVIYNSFAIQNIFSPLDKGELEGVDKFKILSVGRLVPWKGFNTLIEIMKDTPNVELEIIGDGPLKEQLELQATSYKLQANVKLLGKLAHDEVVQKMYSSDLFVLNSAYEGLSHVILEAMAVGLPVAVSRAGGNTELVGENEERGYLFDYNHKEQIREKINYIISHPEEAKEKSKKASAWGGNFSKDKMINELEKILN